MITSNLEKALDKLAVHDIYFIGNTNNRCYSCIDGFIHCGRNCTTRGAAWRLLRRFTLRHEAFEANHSGFWASMDAVGATDPTKKHTKMKYRENVLLNDVLASECCNREIYALAQPSTAEIINKSVVDSFLGRNVRSSNNNCDEMNYDGHLSGEAHTSFGNAGALVHLSLYKELPRGGRLAYTPTSVVGNFQGAWRIPPAVRSNIFSNLTIIEPPALAHYVGATPYKIEYMQAFGMWNYSVDRAAFKFGQLNRGKISSHGCNTEKFDCPGQMQFNGLETARQVYFTQTFARQAAEAEQRYLLLHLDVWPAELPALARLWVAAERLSRALGREMVAWNLPCAFAWSDAQAVIESAELGIRAAVVRRKCSFGVANNASRREHLPLRFDGPPEPCCTIFFDLLDGVCGGLGEQLFACTDHVHRHRFEQAVTQRDLQEAVAVSDAPGLAEALRAANMSARVMLYRAPNASSVLYNLERIIATARSTPPFRHYRQTGSRKCEGGEGLCTAPIAIVPVHKNGLVHSK